MTAVATGSDMTSSDMTGAATGSDTTGSDMTSSDMTGAATSEWSPNLMEATCSGPAAADRWTGSLRRGAAELSGLPPR